MFRLLAFQILDFFQMVYILITILSPFEHTLFTESGYDSTCTKVHSFFTYISFFLFPNARLVTSLASFLFHKK